MTASSAGTAVRRSSTQKIHPKIPRMCERKNIPERHPPDTNISLIGMKRKQEKLSADTAIIPGKNTAHTAATPGKTTAHMTVTTHTAAVPHILRQTAAIAEKIRRIPGKAHRFTLAAGRIRISRLIIPAPSKIPVSSMKAAASLRQKTIAENPVSEAMRPALPAATRSSR